MSDMPPRAESDAAHPERAAEWAALRERAGRAEAALAEAVEARERCIVCSHALSYAERDAKKHAAIMAERDAAEAQLAALREAAGAKCSDPACDGYACPVRHRRIADVLANTEAAAEAYTRRVRAEALEWAATRLSDHDSPAWHFNTYQAGVTGEWLRARADEIRGGR